MNSRTFALLVAVDRARLDLTPDELAARVGLMAGCGIVEAFEDGIAIPTPDVLARLADELGWSEAEVAPLLHESRRGLNRRSTSSNLKKSGLFVSPAPAPKNSQP